MEGSNNERAPRAAVRRAGAGENPIAYQLPEVVDATGVAAVLSEKEEEDRLKRRQRRYLVMGGSLCFLVALLVIVPLAVLSSRQSPQLEVVLTLAPSPTPSLAPSEAPTLEMVSDQMLLTIDFIRQQETNVIWDNGQEWWNNKTSAPYRAAKWVAEEGIYDNLKLLQRYVLATFYYSTNWGQDWEQCHPQYGACPGEPWLSPKDECNWGFVTCDDKSKVTSLNFSPQGNTLMGTLPPQLSLLSHLQICALPNNRLQGGNTTFHVIDQAFYGLSSLEFINLYDNEFSSSIPTRIWTNNPTLRGVALDQNRLTGSLPEELALATSCTELKFQGNLITGTIPSSLGLLQSNLEYLHLGDNRLAGSLPSQFFALTQLTTLYLTNNTQLTGDFHNDQRFTQLINLKDFYADFTQLQGTLPSTLFESLTNLQTWNVNKAALEGTLPEEIALWNATLETLWLQNNRFTGMLPKALEELTTLYELRLEGNDFLGTIPQAICARRGTGFQQLHTLTVDCSVECSCCDFYEEECG